MFIGLSNSSDKPIYEQITQQIKQSIFSGKLTVGEPLPSIRALAKYLKISVMTTKRAYADLERDGFIESCRIFAGKTATIKCILDLQKKDAGKIKVFGKKCRWMNCSSNLKLVWYLKTFTFLKI